MNLTEKVKELATALNSSVYMPYENIIISAHDLHGGTHIEYYHADPFIVTGHICALIDHVAVSLHMDRKAAADFIRNAYLYGGEDFDKQADQGDDHRDTGTPAGDR